MPESVQTGAGAGAHAPASTVSGSRNDSVRLSPSQYLVLLSIMLGAAVGDALLSRGMRQVGQVSLREPLVLIHALMNPFVATGIVVLIAFMASYMAALSWADLTFVQPATAFGNVVTAWIGHVWLGEAISPAQWTGITLIVLGVGFVANGPSKTAPPASELPMETAR